MHSTPHYCKSNAIPHSLCGCSYLAHICCLTCPLITCILELEHQPRRAQPRAAPKTRQRGLLIYILSQQGHTPLDIRKQLGITREQYKRATSTNHHDASTHR